MNVRMFGLLAAALVALVALAACSSQPAEPDMSAITDAVESAVQRVIPGAVEEAVGEQLTADEVDAIVRQVTEEAVANDDRDIEGMVARAVEDAVGEQLTEDQIRSVVAASLTEQMTSEMMDLGPLIVGNLNGFTGPLTEFATPLRNSVELAAEHVNRAGGIHGSSMLIISRDTAVNPTQGVDSARALVDVENAVAVVGALSSGVTIAVANSVMIPKERLIISGASTAPSITVLEDNDYVFRTAPSDAAQGIVLANLATEQGYETAGIIYINNAYGEGLADQFEQTFTASGGQVTAKIPHEDAQPSYVSELEKATDGDPDVLVTISYPGQAQVYIRESLEGDYADTFLFVDGVKGSDWIDAIDGWASLEGTHGTAPGGPDRPEKATFEQAYLNTFGYPVSHPFMAEHYDATVLIALAAAKAGTTTDSAMIRDALRDVANAPGEVVGPGRAGIARAFDLLASGRDINYEGASGVVDIDGNGDVFGPIEIWKIEGGAIMSTGRFELP